MLPLVYLETTDKGQFDAVNWDCVERVWVATVFESGVGSPRRQSLFIRSASGGVTRYALNEKNRDALDRLVDFGKLCPDGF